MMSNDDKHRLMSLIDTATDFGRIEDGPGAPDDEADSYRLARIQEQIGAALGAMVMLLARRDEEVCDLWSGY